MRIRGTGAPQCWFVDSSKDRRQNEGKQGGSRKRVSTCFWNTLFYLMLQHSLRDRARKWDKKKKKQNTKAKAAAAAVPKVTLVDSHPFRLLRLPGDGWMCNENWNHNEALPSPSITRLRASFLQEALDKESRKGDHYVQEGCLPLWLLLWMKWSFYNINMLNNFQQFTKLTNITDLHEYGSVGSLKAKTRKRFLEFIEVGNPCHWSTKSSWFCKH